MAPASVPEPLAAFVAQNGALVERLYAQAKAPRWQLARQRFAESLHRSAARRFPGCAAGAGELEAYLAALELEDLALACACGCGNQAAWEFFVARYRGELRGAARAILAASGSVDDARAEELADSLFAELYGLGPAGQTRPSPLFDYFHGRSKLGTWLRSVLAQRHVDAVRARRRTISLDAADENSARLPEPFTEATPADPDRERYLTRFDSALTAALAELPGRDRLRLALFYLDQRTLAEIGRTLGEHESTASRQLERTRRALHKRVRELLSRAVASGRPAGAAAGQFLDAGLDPAQIELAFEYALDNGTFDLSRALSGGSAGVGSP